MLEQLRDGGRGDRGGGKGYASGDAVPDQVQSGSCGHLEPVRAVVDEQDPLVGQHLPVVAGEGANVPRPTAVVLDRQGATLDVKGHLIPACGAGETDVGD